MAAMFLPDFIAMPGLMESAHSVAMLVLVSMPRLAVLARLMTAVTPIR